MDDDFEIEVTDLNTGATIRHSLANNAPNNPNNPNDPHGPDRDDDDLPPRQTTLKQRRLRTAIVVGVLLLAVVLVISINPVAQASFATVFRLPTAVPSPTLLPGGNLVFLVRGAPWGAVTLDGKQAPYANLGMSSSWVKLTPGRHRLVVKQPPFATVQCTVSLPVAQSDTCPLLSPFNNDNQQFYGESDIPVGSRLVDLGARFSKLSQHDQNTLVDAIKTQLQPSDTPLTLQPGDHYLRDDGSIAVAQTTLQANFQSTVLTPADTAPSDSQSCVSFCDMSGIDNSSSGTWDIMVALVGNWRIATPAGEVVVEHAPMFANDPTYGGFSPSLQVMMSMLWTGDWQVSAQNEFGAGWSPVCQAAQQMMSNDLTANNMNITSMGAQGGPTPEWGCAISLLLDAPTQSDPIHLYYHFGVLLAANTAARRAFPSLPVASAAERALTQQLLVGITA